MARSSWDELDARASATGGTIERFGAAIVWFNRTSHWAGWIFIVTFQLKRLMGRKLLQINETCRAGPGSSAAPCTESNNPLTGIMGYCAATSSERLASTGSRRSAGKFIRKLIAQHGSSEGIFFCFVREDRGEANGSELRITSRSTRWLSRSHQSGARKYPNGAHPRSVAAGDRRRCRAAAAGSAQPGD